MSLSRRDFIRKFSAVLERDRLNETQEPMPDGPHMAGVVGLVVQSSQILPPTYLSRGLCDDVSRDCYFHHYAFMGASLPASMLDRLLSRDIILYSSRQDRTNYTITASITPDHHHEGELTLHFSVDGKVIYSFSFTIVPGRAIGIEDRQAILISRMQGGAGKYPEIKLATKEMAQVSPQAVLFAAVQGIAQAIGVDHIAGPSAINQVGYADGQLELFQRVYDDFFLSAGAVGPERGFYISNRLTPPKPLTSVKEGHRIRTKIKRRLKAEITTAVCDTWRLNIRPSAGAQDSGRLGEPESSRQLQRGRETWIEALIEQRQAAVRIIAQVKESGVPARPIWMSKRGFHYRVLMDGIFDSGWYLDRYPDLAGKDIDPVKHYLEQGAREGRDPNFFFSTSQYLAENDDVRRSGINPLVHYCLAGAAEGRNPFRQVNVDLTETAAEVAPSLKGRIDQTGSAASWVRSMENSRWRSPRRALLGGAR